MTRILGVLAAASVLIVTPAMAQKRPRSPEAAFKRLDANGDGRIDKTEFERRAKDEAKREKAFARVDGNGDGSISLEEFTEIAKKRAERAKK
jgi:Ca2+-binding EF-hand superfamily protein